jgi:Na+-transporting NADH:ubiquinone oxidoreductase subunit NqrC
MSRTASDRRAGLSGRASLLGAWGGGAASGAFSFQERATVLVLIGQDKTDRVTLSYTSTNDQASSARARMTGAANTSQNKTRRVFLPFVMIQLWPKIYQSLRIVTLENTQAVLPWHLVAGAAT